MSSASFLRKSFIGLFAIALTASLLTACGEKEKKETSDPGREEYIRGIAAFETKDYKTAITYFMLAADKDNMDAQYMLGKCYELGIGVDKNEEEAEKWIRKAGEKAFKEYLLQNVGRK